MPLYDRRLPAVIAAAELGSFAKAAARLHVSTPALMRQVDGLEAELGLTLFVRGTRGVSPTALGRSLVEDARALVRQSDDALRRARELQEGAAGTVRLGVSVMAPAHKTLDAWPRIHELEPALRLELVPLGDIYDEVAGVVPHLGDGVDLVQTAWSPQRWEGRCRALPIGEASLAVDVPSHSPLATRGELRPADLAGKRVHVLRHASPVWDELRDELARAGADVIDEDTYDLRLFNECAETGEALVTSGAWSGLHPMLRTVPLAWTRRAACVLLYPLHPAPPVRKFVDAFDRVLGEGVREEASHR